MDEVGPDQELFGVPLGALHTLSSDSSDSFSTSAVFVCPSCGMVVDVRHRICLSCHTELAFCELEDAHEQDLGTPSDSSVDTLMDSSHSGSSALAVDADAVGQSELNIDSSGF